MNHNPYLKPWKAARPNNVAGKGQIEVPGEVENMVWQTRMDEPSAYENALGDALEEVFEAGATTLDEVVAGLNQRRFRRADGSAWTTDQFEAEMARLGA
jgi:hypothetical protein